jgi:hypothetical protein
LDTDYEAEQKINLQKTECKNDLIKLQKDFNVFILNILVKSNMVHEKVRSHRIDDEFSDEILQLACGK